MPHRVALSPLGLLHALSRGSYPLQLRRDARNQYHRHRFAWGRTNVPPQESLSAGCRNICQLRSAKMGVVVPTESMKLILNLSYVPHGEGLRVL